jgi:hypothetical protein
MCTDIYIGSNKVLPLIEWNVDAPEFYVRVLDLEGEGIMVSNILKSKYLYEVGSHIGCACGLSYGDWSKKSVSENHSKRVEDVSRLMSYLGQHKISNEIRVFSTSWGFFPDEYESVQFDISFIDKEEFSFEEDIILLIK